MLKKKVNVVLGNVNDHQWPNVQPSRERRYHHLPTSIMGVQESPGLDRRSMMNSMKHWANRMGGKLFPFALNILTGWNLTSKFRLPTCVGISYQSNGLTVYYIYMLLYCFVSFLCYVARNYYYVARNYFPCVIFSLGWLHITVPILLYVFHSTVLGRTAVFL